MRTRPSRCILLLVVALSLVSCGGGDGNRPGRVPTLTLTSSASEVAPGESFELNWSAQNATSCVATGGWQGTRPTSGTEQVGPIGQQTVYSMQCSSSAGTVMQSVTVMQRIPMIWTKQLTAEHEGGAVTLRWSDETRDAVAYFVDRATAGSQWSQMAQLPGYVDSHRPREWQDIVTVPSRFRVRVATQSGEFLLRGSGDASFVEIDPSRVVSIKLDTPEPIVDGTFLTIEPQGWSPIRVEYGIDAAYSWENAGRPDFRTYLDTAFLSSGAHLLIARALDEGYAVTTLGRRNVVVDKSGARATISATFGANWWVRRIQVLTSSDQPVSSVTFFVNGVAGATLEAPNSEAPTTCCGGRPAFTWDWDVAGLASGTYKLRAVARTVAGQETAAEQDYALRQVPQLTVDRPALFELVSSSLTVSGTVKDDIGGVYVKATVYIGSQSKICYWDFGTEFSATCDLSSLPEGAGYLYVLAGNADKFEVAEGIDILFSKDTAARFERSIEVKDGWMAAVEAGTLLFVDSGRVMLRRTDGSILDITPPGEEILPAPASPYLGGSDWYPRDRRLQISEGRVVIDGIAGTYLWNDGTTTLLKEAHRPVLKWPWLLLEATGGLELRHLVTGETFAVTGSSVEPFYCTYDLHVDASGDVHLYLCRTPDGSLPPERRSGNVYHYRLHSSQMTVLTTDGRYSSVQTDGVRVLYVTGPAIYASFPEAADSNYLGSIRDVPARTVLSGGFIAWESRNWDNYGLSYMGVRLMTPSGETKVLSGPSREKPLLLDLQRGTVLLRDSDGRRTRRWARDEYREIAPWWVTDGLIDGEKTLFSKSTGTRTVIFLEK